MGEREELIKYTYVDNRYSLEKKVFSFALNQEEGHFQVSQKSNCLYDYILEYRADLTFSVYTAGD
jgi:hypothetical protein